MNNKQDFIGIGATKAGTTWVSKMLDAHPDVCMSEPKEVRYFNYMAPGGKFFSADKDTPLKNRNFNKDISWYKKHFKHCRKGQIVGEFTPVYLWDKHAPVEIKKTFPDVKLIVCIRNPIDRAYSHYWMRRNYLLSENRSFNKAIEYNPAYLEEGLYANNLKRYLSLFNLSQVKIIFFEDIKNNPADVVKSLYRFLGVNDSFVPNNLYTKENRAKRARIKGIYKVFEMLPRMLAGMHLSFVVAIMRKWHVHNALMRLFTTSAKYPKMQEKVRKKLRDYYSADIKNLEAMLNKDLSHWV